VAHREAHVDDIVLAYKLWRVCLEAVVHVEVHAGWPERWRWVLRVRDVERINARCATKFGGKLAGPDAAGAPSAEVREGTCRGCCSPSACAYVCDAHIWPIDWDVGVRQVAGYLPHQVVVKVQPSVCQRRTASTRLYWYRIEDLKSRLKMYALFDASGAAACGCDCDMVV
jgi:hypothetical protein